MTTFTRWPYNYVLGNKIELNDNVIVYFFLVFIAYLLYGIKYTRCLQ